MDAYYETMRDDMTKAHAWRVANDHFAPHFHHSIELAYVLSGLLVATLDGTEYPAGPGTVVLSSSYTVHNYHTPEASESIVAIVPLTAVPSLRPVLSKQSFARPTYMDADGTLGLLMHMMTEAIDKPVIMKGLCYTVIGLLIDRVGMVDTRVSSRMEFIRDVLEYLQQHHTEPLSVDRVASHFGYSRSRFSHIFNAQLGYTLSDYVGAIRCRHAAQLLRETDMAVSDIAMAVGFESLRTFYRTFKEQYGMTPNRYAKATNA